MSLEAGFTAYPSLAAYDRGTEVHSPELVAEPPSTAAAAAPAPAVMAPPASPQAVAPQGSVATLDRPRETSVVSSPPKRQAPAPRKPAPSGPPIGSYRPYLLGAAALVVVALLVGILYLPTATATVSVQGTAVNADTTLLGAPGTAAGSPDHFATQAIHADESQNLPGTPTGQKQIDAAKASGQVTFKASCSGFVCSIPIRSGTDVSTGSGKHYVTTKSVTVQSTLVSQGSVDAPVAAVQAGSGGNTESDTIRYINNNNPDDLLSVNNAQAIGGGLDARTATVIQQSDIDSLRDVYAKDALPRVTDQLNGKAQGQKVVLVGGGVQATAKADHAVGEEVGGFTVTIKVAGDGVAFDEKAVQKMLKSFLERKIPQGSQLTTNGTSLKYEPIDATTDGHITLNGHASGFYAPIFLEPAIRSHLKGMSPTKGRAFLQSLPNVVDARVTQSPFGLPWLPLFSSRITLKIQEVSSSSASP
jgi:hypothetical protein